MLKLKTLKEITTQLTVENQERRARNQDDVFVQIRIVVFERIINNKAGFTDNRQQITDNRIKNQEPRLNPASDENEV